MKTSNLFITHDDLDGIIAHVINKVFDIQFDKSLSVSRYANVMDIAKQYDTIVCVDIVPFTEKQYTELIESGKSITIYDHHPRWEWIAKYPSNVLDITKCGSMIYYEHNEKKRNHELFRIVNVTNVYDMWFTKHALFMLSLSYNKLFEGSIIQDKRTLINDLDDENNCFSIFISMIMKKIANAIHKFSNDETTIINEEIRKDRREFGIIKRNFKTFKDSRDLEYGVINITRAEIREGNVVKIFDDNKDLSYILCRTKNGVLVYGNTEFYVPDLKGIRSKCPYVGRIKLHERIVNDIMSGTSRLQYN